MYIIFILNLKVGAECSQFKSMQKHIQALKNGPPLKSFNSIKTS